MRKLMALGMTNMRLELRARETLTLVLCLAIMLAVVASLGIGSGLFDPETRLRLMPALIWIVFLFSATVAIGRSFEHEMENRALDGLLLTGVPVWQIFLAKTACNLTVLLAGQFFAVLTLALFLNVDLADSASGLALISLLVIMAYAALATLLAGISIGSRLRQVLLPLLLLPLIFPVMFAAVELSTQLLVLHELDYTSVWFSLLLALDAIYVYLGVNLFEHVIRE